MGKLIPAHPIRTLPLWDGVCCGSYDGLQGAGNRDFCAVATQRVSKRNPCWPGWRPARCHRALESSGDRRFPAHRGKDRRTDAFDFYMQISTSKFQFERGHVAISGCRSSSKSFGCIFFELVTIENFRFAQEFFYLALLLALCDFDMRRRALEEHLLTYLLTYLHKAIKPHIYER